jgi:hypothetical protein
MRIGRVVNSCCILYNGCVRTPVAIVLTLATPLAAHGESRSTHVTLSGDIAATDNVFATTADQKEGDLFLTVRPGVLFGYDAPRMIHDLALEGEIIEFLAHSEKPSVALRLAERSTFIPSRFTTLVLALSGSNGVLTALSSRNSPEQTGPQVTPIGRVDTIQGDASLSLSYESGRDWTTTLGGFARASRTDGNEDILTMGAIPTITKSAEAGGSLGFDRTFRRGDALSLEVGASILRLERDADPNAIQGPRLDRQVNPRGRFQWRHDFNRRWSGALDGGAVWVRPYGTDPDNPTAEGEDHIFPIAGATLAYTDVWGRGALLARRDITPNLFVAQNTVNDTALVSLAMPLELLDDSRRRQPRFIFLGSLGVNRTALINAESAEVESEFYIGRIDVGLGYTPRPGFTYGLRYEFVYQTGDNAAVMAIPGYYRNTISFTYTIRYPDRIAGGEATLKKRKGGSVRADGKDLVPIGVDPITTDFGSGDGDGGDE